MATYLDRIIAAHRETAAADRRDVAGLADQARACPPTRGFAAALRDGPLAVVAEIKRRSPSKGDLDPDLNPAVLASTYRQGGAAALSVLTDSAFFSGSPADLRAARRAVDLPVLRKDFTVSLADVYDARIMGADALLLIVAALSAGELADFFHAANEVGIDALVEVHDEAEAEQALGVGATLIGINQRDLFSFEVDTARAQRVVKALPSGVTKVAESGIHQADDARVLADAGFDALLVGEALVTAADPAAALMALRGR